MRRFIQLLAAIVIAAHLTACTSSEEPGDGDEAVAEESSEADAPADGDIAENIDSGEPSESSEAPPEGEAVAAEPPADGAAPEGFLDEQLPEDSMGTADSGEAPPPEIAAEPPADSAAPEGFSAPPPVSDTPAEPSTEVATTEPAPTEPSTDTTFTESSGSESSDVGSSEPEPEPVAAPKPLLKAEVTPFNRGGQLLNAIYVSRPGDSFSSMARMIYGDESRAGDLKKANSWVNNLVPGTKIYYNSPQRPTDETRILTYYEDAGIAPEIYAAQPGENLKTVSKNLLGYDGAWKEVWALNSVDTKGDITEPTQLRYWKGGAGTVAATPPPVETAPTPPPVEEPIMTPPPAELPPPTDPSQNMAMNEPPPPVEAPPEEMAPPPPADLPPPPPPVEALNPPPPPPSEETACSPSTTCTRPMARSKCCTGSRWKSRRASSSR